MNEPKAVRYWKHPEKKNGPEEYATPNAQTKCKIIAVIVSKYADKDDMILELGCNCGNTLNSLYELGFNRLHGVDINEKAITLARQLYPSMAKETHLTCSNIKDYVDTWANETFSVIYTSAVLVHIPYEYDFIFAKIVNLLKCGGYLIIKEDEHEKCDRKFPRNYQDVFEKLGLKQLDSFPFEFNKGYMVRVFKK